MTTPGQTIDVGELGALLEKAQSLREDIAEYLNPVVFRRDEHGRYEWTGATGDFDRAQCLSKADVILKMFATALEGHAR